MTKTKLIGFLIIILGLFFTAPRVMDAQFPIIVECQPPLTTFSDGNSIFDISFPPGGGTTCDTITDCPTVSLPAAATVYSVKVDMELSDPASEIGTPYIWVPKTSGLLYQIDTRNGSEGVVTTYPVGTNPSRTFVIPGGDVWVANRNSNDATRLSPLTGNQPAGGGCGNGLCGTDETIYSCPGDCSGSVCGGAGLTDCREYKVVGTYGTGGAGPRGVTGDVNGFVWVGNYSSGNVVKMDPVTGAVLSTVATGGGPYGLIADQFGYVWVSNRGSGRVQAIDVNTGIIVKSVVIGNGGPYGIGIDDNGDILVATCCGNGVYKINGYGTAVPGTVAPGFPVSLVGGVSTRGRGIASDLNGNIWVGSDSGGSGTVYSFKPDGSQYCPPYNAGHNTVGVAIDSNNNVWVIPYDGNVLKLRPDNVAACTAVVPVATVFIGSKLYNYSDMTGLRTIPQNLKIGAGTIGVPLSSTNTFEVCTDGTGTCTNSLPCAAITAMLAGCIPNAMGNCELPLEIFSITAGDYTLSNLEVIYGKEVPMTIGGLVPCGRNWDDPRTPLWNEKAPCNFCFLLMMINNIMNFLLMLAAGIAVLALIITGLLSVTSSGDSERKSQSKTALKYSIWGFIVIFISWIIIDFILIGWGYLDPLGGQWNIVDCDISRTFCGDNIRQTPNDYGFFEECDGTDNPCPGACTSACTCAFVPPVPLPISITSASVVPPSGPIGTVFTITATITAPAGVNPATTIAHIQDPDESPDVATIPLVDDGTSGDLIAGDGIYTGTWTSTALGSYFVDIDACDTAGNCIEAENI